MVSVVEESPRSPVKVSSPPRSPVKVSNPPRSPVKVSNPPKSPVKVSNSTIVEKRRWRVPKSPVSPPVENIEGEEEKNNNWMRIDEKWMDGWMDGWKDSSPFSPVLLLQGKKKRVVMN